MDQFFNLPIKCLDTCTSKCSAQNVWNRTWNWLAWLFHVLAVKNTLMLTTATSQNIPVISTNFKFEKGKPSMSRALNKVKDKGLGTNTSLNCFSYRHTLGLSI